MTGMLCCSAETPADEPGIDRVVLAAFGQPGEARLVTELREAGGLVFSAVAKLQGEVVAHVAYSEVTIGGRASQPAVLAIAPVAVAPHQQRCGYGSQLIRWSFDELKRRDFPAVIVLGEPEFYRRFGFGPASGFGIQCPFDVTGEHFMALELQPGALADQSGVVGYRPEFAALS